MTDERALRFDKLLSEIEMLAQAIRASEVEDIPLAMGVMMTNVTEAQEIAWEVSREALDKVTE